MKLVSVFVTSRKGDNASGERQRKYGDEGHNSTCHRNRAPYFPSCWWRAPDHREGDSWLCVQVVSLAGTFLTSFTVFLNWSGLYIHLAVTSLCRRHVIWAYEANIYHNPPAAALYERDIIHLATGVWCGSCLSLVSGERCPLTRGGNGGQWRVHDERRPDEGTPLHAVTLCGDPDEELDEGKPLPGAVGHHRDKLPRGLHAPTYYRAHAWHKTLGAPASNIYNWRIDEKIYNNT